MSKVVCIYHHPGNGCLDGSAAAWIVRRAYPEVTLIGANYGDAPPLDQIESGANVYIVDFSYPPEQLKLIEHIALSVTVIDHHATAIRKLESYRHHGPYTILRLDTSASGAVLTWRYLYPTIPIPSWIQAVGDRDTWQFNHQYTNEVCAYIYSKPITMEWLDEIDSTHFDDLAIHGKRIWKPKMDRWLKRIEDCEYRVDFMGYNVPIINIHPTEGASDVLNLMAQGEHFAIGYYNSKEHIHYSFRSVEGQEQSVDVAKLVEPLGGGGHKHAAGWRINRI